MSDEAFQTSVRKLLRTVGVTSQQALEAAVERARTEGELPRGPLTARVVLTVEGLDLTHTVDGKIELPDHAGRIDD